MIQMYPDQVSTPTHSESGFGHKPKRIAKAKAQERFWRLEEWVEASEKWLDHWGFLNFIELLGVGTQENKDVMG